MRTEQVEAFVLAARHGSFAKAGRAMNTHRSTLSAAVQALEDELGVSVFTRSGNSLRLSAAGETILADCQRMLQSAKSIQQRCNQLSQGVESKLKVARDDAIPEPIWRQALHALQLKFSATSIEAYLVPAQEHQALLQAQSVDVAFGLSQPGLSGEVIASMPYLLVTSPAHPLSQIPLVSKRDLKQNRQICLAYMVAGKLHHSAMFALGVDSANYTAMTSYELIRDAIIAGHGWGVLPKFLIADALADQTLIHLQHELDLPAARFQASYLNEPGQVALWLQHYLREQLRE